MTEKQFWEYKDSEGYQIKKIISILDENGAPFEVIYKVEQNYIKYKKPDWDTICNWIWGKMNESDI